MTTHHLVMIMMVLSRPQYVDQGIIKRATNPFVVTVLVISNPLIASNFTHHRPFFLGHVNVLFVVRMTIHHGTTRVMRDQYSHHFSTHVIDNHVRNGTTRATSTSGTSTIKVSVVLDQGRISDN